MILTFPFLSFFLPSFLSFPLHLLPQQRLVKSAEAGGHLGRLERFD